MDDYIHLINKHQSDLESIQDDLITNYNLNKCQIKKCNFTQRHHRIISDGVDNVNNDNLKEINFISEIIDSLHYYICHIFDAGLRASTK